MTHQHVDRVAVLECENAELKSRLSQSEQRAKDLEVRAENAEAAATHFEGEKNALEAQLAQMTKERDAAILDAASIRGIAAKWHSMFMDKMRLCNKQETQLAAAREALNKAKGLANQALGAHERFLEAGDDSEQDHAAADITVALLEIIGLQPDTIKRLMALSAAPLARPVDRYREALSVLQEALDNSYEEMESEDFGIAAAATSRVAEIKEKIKNLAHPSEGGKEAPHE